MLTEQQKQLLHKLIDKYENRSAYGANEKLKQRVKIGINEREFPDYYHTSESNYRKEFNIDCSELEKAGYLICDWEKFSKGEELKRISLHEDAVPKILRVLNRKSKSEQYCQMEHICLELMQEAPRELHTFYDDMLQQIRNINPLPSIFSLKSEDETRRAIHGLNQLFLNDKEITMRKWSIKLYNDSKEFEYYGKRIINVIKKYVSPDKEDMDEKGILETFGVTVKPLMVKIYGKWVIQTDYGKIDFAADRFGIGIHPENLSILNTELLDVKAIVTIENETSYYDYIEYCHSNQLDHLVVYLGGFHNSARRKILVSISECVNARKMDVNFFHWGDIDLGGMFIYKRLCEDTGIFFTPIYMDPKTYLKFVEHGSPITETYIQKISALLEKNEFSMFHDVIPLILNYKRKIEQEIVDINM
ncbi:Wadjet anti-phage system protein JetD domain-containing protein [Paenibacillus sp. Marseille-Q4541]|uniref:Wadjet anti-phage system protein JetD domain-containing protein n=1 Tax=Paenibacillus sp. Marseille-Q4541 TaxID=2831522 RepID=UPI001BABCF65|nr:Wadjet anti-phage system protein JetD domain-containing protein [Paenibacillus sp. Marseille-Q4541]